MYDYVVLGGGVAGIAAAYKLQGKNYLLLEKENQLGGLASSYKIKSYFIEKYYHHLFRNDKEVIKLAETLGIKILWKRTKMGFFYDGKIYGFNSPLDLLRFRPLNFLNRIKFGLNLFKRENEEKLNKLSAEEWLREKWGDEIYEKIFYPLLKFKFGSFLDRISAAFVYGRLKARKESRKLRGELLGYIDINELIGKMHRDLNIKLNAEVKKIKKDKRGYSILLGNKEEIKAKKIISTIPIPVFNRVSKGKINVSYEGVICVLFNLRRKLSNYYWINVIDKEIPFGAVIEHTNFKEYGGDNLVYVVNYSDKIIDIEEYKKGLKKMFPFLKEEDFLWWRISKDEYATPVFVKNYFVPKNIDKIFFAGSSMIYPNSRNINNVIKSGFEAVERCAE